MSARGVSQIRVQLNEFATKTLKYVRGNRFDSADALFFTRQLEKVYSETYDVQYPELPMGNGDVVKFDTSVGVGYKTFTYYTYGSTGIAAIVNAYDTASIPKVGLNAKETTGRVRFMANSYGYNMVDLEAASVAGSLNLDSSLSDAAKRGHVQLRNTIGWFGDTTNGLPGLLTFPNTTHTLAPVGASTFRTWATKTVQEIMADVNTLVMTPRTLSNGIENVNVCYVPDSVKTNLMGRHVDTGNGSNITIWNLIVDTYPSISFKSAFELQAANHPLVAQFAGLNVAVAFNDDIKKVAFVVPRVFEQKSPPQEEGYNYNIFCHSNIGGIKCPYPLSISVMIGI